MKNKKALLILVPCCIAVNYVGKLLASLLKLPLFLDSIGTCLGGTLGGPLIGAICGALNNLIYGFTTGNNVTLIYAFTSIGIGVVVGVMAKAGFMKNFSKAMVTGICTAAIAILISTPLNINFWGGYTGNVWGDFVFNVMTSHGISIALSSFVDELILDIPDKLITLMFTYFIFKAIPPKITSLYGIERDED